MKDEINKTEKGRKMSEKTAHGTKKHIESLETTGYCVVPQILSGEQVSRGLELVKKNFNETLLSQSDRVPFLNKNQPTVYNLQSKDPFFLDLLFSLKTLEGLLKHFLNDMWFKSVPEGDPNYILRSYMARSSKRQMPMHIDSFIPYTGSFVYIMQCAIILEDQDENNGCTVVVPGSHLRAEYTTQEAFDEAVPVISRAGDLVLWDSRLWHGAMANNSGHSRWSVIATFSRWWLKQAFDIPGNLPQEIYDGLTDSQKAVLGYCSVPYDNETVGIDMKRSYELLPEKVENWRL